MSKNKKRYRKQRQNFPWLPITLGGVLLLIAAFFFTNQGGSGGTIQVDTQKIDYGYVKFGENKSFTINVTNTGDKPLRFREKPYVEVLKGC